MLKEGKKKSRPYGPAFLKYRMKDYFLTIRLVAAEKSLWVTLKV